MERAIEIAGAVRIGQRMLRRHRRAKRKRSGGAAYCETTVRCVAHDAHNPLCALRTQRFFRLGHDTYLVDGANQQRPADNKLSALTLSEAIRQRRALAERAVDDDETQFCAWLAVHGCKIRVVDSFYCEASSSNDADESDSDNSSVTDSGRYRHSERPSANDCALSPKRQRCQSPTDSYDSECCKDDQNNENDDDHDDGDSNDNDDDDDDEEKDDNQDKKSTNDDTLRLRVDDRHADEQSWQTSEAEHEHRARYGDGAYACYLLQSLYQPSRTYVGMTNNRFQRLRRHNGEITGGARATRAHRPWRMIAFVDGFGRDKIAALRFEWSWRHPRKRRLRKPWHRREGRLNCARQVLTSDEWRDWPLRLIVRPVNDDDDDHDAEHSEATSSTVPNLAELNGSDRQRIEPLIVCRALCSEQQQQEQRVEPLDKANR